MSNFTLHTKKTAPLDSKTLLDNSFEAFGMIPNLHAVMAESPQLLKAYQRVHQLFSNSSLDKNELTIVWQTINKAHNCNYCIPAHSAVAQMMGADPAVDEAIRSGTVLPTKKMEVLREITLAMVEQRGKLEDPQLEKFFSVGYKKQQLLDIILGISQKVMSNYTNHIAKTSIDKNFQQFA